MKYWEWFAIFCRTHADHQDWRVGQAAFNSLLEHRPDLAEKIRGDPDLDPFYYSSKLPEFYSYLKANW